MFIKLVLDIALQGWIMRVFGNMPVHLTFFKLSMIVVRETSLDAYNCELE